MSEFRDSKCGKEYVDDRLLRQSERRRLRYEVKDLLREEREKPDVGNRAADELARLERIAERSSMRRTRDFDPGRERQLENLEIRAGKGLGYLRRHLGEGLDAATRREVRKELVKLEKDGELDWLKDPTRKTDQDREAQPEQKFVEKTDQKDRR